MERTITVPDMILWTGTRVALGVGIGMLVSAGLTNDARKSTGIALTAVGAFTTVPFVLSIFGKKRALELRSAA